MASDFFWSLKKSIDEEMLSLSRSISDLDDKDLSYQDYLRISKQSDHIQNLFDQISIVYKDLELTQANPELYQLLEANQKLNDSYGQFHRLRSSFLHRYSKDNDNREEVEHSQSQNVSAEEDEPSEEPLEEFEEEESLPEEEEEYDPEAEKKAQRKERHEKLADEAKKREKRRQDEQRRFEEQRRVDDQRRYEEQLREEQAHRREEAARLGLNVRPDQQYADVELYHERLRQEEQRELEQQRVTDRIREENEAMRRTRERIEQSDRYESFGHSHIDMSMEGIGHRKDDLSYEQSYPQVQSSSFTPQYLTPSGISSIVSSKGPDWSTVDNNEKLYSNLLSNQTGSEPLAVSAAFETQMRFNIERARMAYLDVQGTDAAPAAVHEYIQQRNAFSEYQNALKQGSFYVSETSVKPYASDFNKHSQSNQNSYGNSSVVTSLTPTGTVSEMFVNGFSTGNRYEFMNPGLRYRPAFTVNNPMVVSEKYEQAITSQMEQAKVALSSVVANGDAKASPVDSQQLKMYTDAYLAFQSAKRAGTVVVSSTDKALDVPDYVSWQQIRQAQTSRFSAQNAPFAVSGQPKGANPNFTSKKTVEETVANIFNQGSHLKQQSVVSMYGGIIGNRLEGYSHAAMSSLGRGVYGIAQSGENNALRTMEQGRYYITTAAGVVMALGSSAPTSSLAHRVAHASTREFRLFGTNSLLSNSEISSHVNNGLRMTRELDVKISDIEKKLAPMNAKMEQYLQAHPGSRKLDGLDKFSQREYEQLTNHLRQLRENRKTVGNSLTMHSKLQQLRHESQIESKLINQLKGDKGLPKSPKALQEAAGKISKQVSLDLDKKYGALARVTDKSLAKEIALMKQQGSDLKKQIQLLQAKGSALTSSERKLLIQLKGESKALGVKLSRFVGLSKDRADLLLMNKKLEKIISSAYKNRQRLTGGINILQSFMVRALQTGADSGTDGLGSMLSISYRLSSNRYVRILVKEAYRGAIAASKLGMKAAVNLISPGSAEAISQAINIAKIGVKAKVGVAKNAAKSAIKTGVKAGVRTASKGISSVVPDGIKTGVKSGIRSATSIGKKVSGRFRRLRNGIAKIRNRFASSWVGRSISAASRSAAAISEALKAALSAAKTFLLKALAIGFGVFLLIALLSVAFTALGGGAGSAVIAAPNSDESGKVDLSAYVEIILKEEQAFQAKIDKLASDKSYDNVYVNYANSVNNTKNILSMMAVRFDQDVNLDTNLNVAEYLKTLYQDSHIYSTSVRKYNCSGCKERTVQKTIKNSETGLKEPVFAINPQTGERVPVMITEKYCSGHKDLTVTVSVLVFDDIFAADSSSAGSISLVGNKTKEKVWNFLKDKGLDDIQAAAIMGNIQAESGFDPSIIERGSGIGFGLCQWSYGRRTQLEKFAKSKGKDPSDLVTQLQFFWAEFFPDAKSSYANNQWISSKYKYSSFMETDSIEEATRIFCFGWERPAEEHSHINTRIHSALTYYNMYSGTDSSNYEKPEEDKEEQKEKVFGWDEETIEWCKLIYNMQWKDLYSGVHDYGGVIETGELIVNGDYMWPVSSTRITSRFGYRTSPTAGASTYHKGVDIGIPTGTPVHAVADGVVTASAFHSAAGKYVTIKHANGVETKYKHNSVLCFKAGDKVKQGDVIAYSGNTGVSTGPHLHFEFHVNGTPIDPCLQFGIS